MEMTEEIRQELTAYCRKIDLLRGDIGALRYLIELKRFDGVEIDKGEIEDRLQAIYGGREAARKSICGTDASCWLFVNGNGFLVSTLFLIFDNIVNTSAYQMEVPAIYQALKDMDLCLCAVTAHLGHELRAHAA